MDPLARLAVIARQLGADEIAGDAEAVHGRLGEDRFYVACVGQFKRGKSTLLNTLIGAPLLPTGVLPVTALITIVRYGERSSAIVRFTSGEARQIEVTDLADYVSEERNPGNEKEVAVAEVQVACPLLATGMCLVDTPGLGSTFSDSSETTRRFVPHVDAALLVIGADPPLSAEEAALAAEIGRETPEIIVVLNKADRLVEGDVREAAAFARRALANHLGRDMDLFVVSAIQRCTRDWSKLENRLAELVRDSSGLVKTAHNRAIRRIRSRLQGEIDGRRLALLVPLHETERRVVETQRIAADAQRALADLSFLFASEQQKLSVQLAVRRQRFLDEAIAAPDDEDAAQRIAEERIHRWMPEVEREAERTYTSAIERFGRILRDLGTSEEIDRHLRARSRFYFTALSELTGRSFFRRLDPRTYVRRLLETNSARVVNDIIDRVVESRRQLEKEIADALRATVASSQRTLQHARAAHEAGEERVAAELARLDALETDLAQAPAG